MSVLVKIGSWSQARRGAVVLVHGLDGHVYLTWQATRKPEMLWPRWLVEDLAGVTCFSVSYEAPKSNWSRTAMAIQDRATNVLELLLTNPELTEAPIVFVTHSLGGLIVKELLLDLHQQRSIRPAAAALLDRVRGVVFCATPHTGSRMALWLKRLGLLVRPSKITRALVPDDPALRKLYNSYRAFAEEYRDQIHHLTMFETQATAIGNIVEPSSADPGAPGATAIPLNDDHMSICKPRSRTDQFYVLVKQFVESRINPLPLEPGSVTLPELPAIVRPRRFGALLSRGLRLLVLGVIVWVLTRNAMRWTHPANPSVSDLTSVQRVAGEIQDDLTHEPMAGVLVSLPEFDLETYTSIRGRYEFSVRAPIGTRVRLRAQRDGYRPLNQDPMIGGSHLDVLVMHRERR